MKISKKYLALAVAASFFVAGGAYAATQSVAINMSFATALALTNPTPINFGILQSGTTGTYVLTTTGTLTPSNGGVVVGGTPAAGVVNITGSATQTIAIHTGGYSANGGVTPSAASCLYNGVTTANCDTGVTGAVAPGGGAGRDLTLGVTIAADGTQAAGATPAPTFVVTVIYG